jgi:hypothetical protein
VLFAVIERELYHLLTCSPCEVTSATDARNQWPIKLGMDRRVCLLLTALAMPLWGASDAPLDRATLRGAMAVNVVIDPVPAGHIGT